MVDFGIFIRSTQDDLTILEKCKNLLASIQSDTKITYVSRDVARGGAKVIFDTDSSVAQLLEKKDLDVTSTIHDLRTALIVHEAFPKTEEEEEFKNSIRNKMAASSLQVLDIEKVQLTAEIGTGKWIIILNTPEIEDLDEFKAMGLPENMLLELPNSDTKLKVEFYCRLCQKGGHVQRRCLEATIPSYSNLGQIASPKKSSSTKKNDLEVVNESPTHHLRPEFIQDPPELENQVTTTNCKRRLSCVDDNSNQDPQARKKHRKLPVVIPDVIRQITSEIPDPVLNIQQLEAFFTHAKKKSNLLEIVKAYTSDVEGFKRQLEEISSKYYMSPNVGSEADKQFMKMLKSVLKRLENLSPTPKNVSMTQQIGSEQSCR